MKILSIRPAWICLLIVSCVSVGLVANQAEAALVYDIVNYPIDQNGHNLSGTIETDGTIGTLTQANMVAFDFMITGPVGFQVASNSSDNFGFVDGVEATATSLLLPDGGRLTLTDDPFFGTGAMVLEWRRSVATSSYTADRAAAIFPDQLAWDTSNPTSLGGSDTPWLIATRAVPEPSTALFLTSGVAILLLGTGRRRRGTVRPALALLLGGCHWRSRRAASARC